MTDIQSPAKLIEHYMETFSVSRETAIQVALLGTEATLRADGPDQESITRKLGELIVKASKTRPDWMGEVMASQIRKDLPAWIRVNDEAMERGQDAVTVLSVTESISMDQASEKIKLARASKEGRSVDQLVEMSYEISEAKPDEERHLVFLDAMK